ncbi:ZIP family metal transporter [Flavobacterium sp.]|uniref:ZIP family metal transporter n=1 Tax=Flavobacterium sp. TaxID=239 RepID=UPI0026110565|nr:ZIP family metal transporter [Flavobacterium sp.]
MTALLIPFFSVVLGLIIGFLYKPKKKTGLKLLLAFSGAFLLSLTVLHLLPEIYSRSYESEYSTIGLLIMSGILLQIILEYFSKGAEHGHVHGGKSMTRVPLILAVSLGIHALIEGIPVAAESELAWGIAVHHLPIAVILTQFFRQAHLSNTVVILFMLGFAVATPLGTFLASNLQQIQSLQHYFSAVVVGILFHISSTIIFETSENHKFNFAKLLAIILGIVFGYIL